MKKIVCQGLIALPLVLGATLLVTDRDPENFLNIILASFAATALYTLFVMAARRASITIFNPVDVLGSFFGDEPSLKTKLYGGALHYLTGAILAVDGIALLGAFGLQMRPLTGALWGLLASGGALAFFSTIESIHPRMKKGLTPAPGNFALSYGKATPIVIALGHIIYGLTLGLI